MPAATRSSARGSSASSTRSVSGAPSRTAHTPSVIGSSISRRCPRSRSTGAVVSPSTTMPISAAASSGRAPRAISSPARRFLPEGDQHVTMRSPIPARPANVSGRAPADSARRRISARPRATSAALELSPSERPSAPPAASAMTFFAAAQSSTPTTSSLTYTRKRIECTATWTRTASSRSVARDDGRRRQPAHDLVGDVRPGEHGDRTVPDERRQALAGRRVEALRETDDRRVTRKCRDDLAEHTTWHRDDDEVGVGDRCSVDRRRHDPVEPCIGRVARIAGRPVDRVRLLRIARRERHVVPVVAEEARRRRPPRPRADDDDSHSDVTKSMDTGTPSSPNRARSSFSTQ